MMSVCICYKCWTLIDLDVLSHSAPSPTHGNSTLQFCLNMSYLWLYPLDQSELDYLTC